MGRGCVSGVNDIFTVRPDIAKLMARAKKLNGSNTPKNTSVSGITMVYCTCSKGHTFVRKANKLSQIKRDKNGKLICPVCSGEEVQKGVNSFGDLHKELLEEWDWEKNIKLGIDPFEIRPGSNKKVYWKCKNGHTWEATPNSRINGSKSNKVLGCKYCANQAFWPGWNDIETVLKNQCSKEFVEKFKKEYFAAGNTIPLNKIFANSTKPISTLCSDCGCLNTRTFYYHIRYACKGCTKQVATKNYNLRAINNERADRFDNAKLNLPLMAKDIINGGSKKYAWLCPHCGEIYYDTVGHQLHGRGCTNCTKGTQTSKVEQFLYLVLKNSLDSEVSNRVKVDKKEFDIAVEEKNLYISYENDYHHKQERTIKNDLKAVKIAKSHKMHYLRIIEDRDKPNIVFVGKNKIKYHPRDYTKEQMIALTIKTMQWINKILHTQYEVKIPENIDILIEKNTRRLPKN